jgi:hypothetical protein
MAQRWEMRLRWSFADLTLIREAMGGPYSERNQSSKKKEPKVRTPDLRFLFFCSQM